MSGDGDRGTPQGMGFRNPGICLLLAMALGLGISNCGPDKKVAEADYRTQIVGNWVGDAGDTKESITFDADGGFKARVRSLGFISNTLSQGVEGVIEGTWTIGGRTITLTIAVADDVRLKGRTTSSTILRFYPDEFTLKSEAGRTSTFTRTSSP